MENIPDSEIIKFRNNEFEKLNKRLSNFLNAIENNVNLSEEEKMKLSYAAWMQWYDERNNIAWDYMTAEEFENMVCG